MQPAVVALALVALAAAAVATDDAYAQPAYTYKYSVRDPHSGDIKEQVETRNGDQVKGAYSLVDADGKVRNVEYTSDAKNGFQAVVTRNGKTTLWGYGDKEEQARPIFVAAPAYGDAYGDAYGAAYGAAYGDARGAAYGLEGAWH